MKKKARLKTAAFLVLLAALTMAVLSFVFPPVVGSQVNEAEFQQKRRIEILSHIAIAYHAITGTPVQGVDVPNLDAFLENHPTEKRFLNRVETTPLPLLKGPHISIPGSAVVSFILDHDSQTITQFIYAANMADAIYGSQSKDGDWESPLYTADVRTIVRSKSKPPETRRCIFADRFTIDQIAETLKQFRYSNEAFKKLFRPIQAKYNSFDLKYTDLSFVAASLKMQPPKSTRLHLRGLLLLFAFMTTFASAMMFLMARPSTAQQSRPAHKKR